MTIYEKCFKCIHKRIEYKRVPVISTRIIEEAIHVCQLDMNMNMTKCGAWEPIIEIVPTEEREYMINCPYCKMGYVVFPPQDRGKPHFCVKCGKELIANR